MEDTKNGRGIYTWSDGMCHMAPWGPSAGPDLVHALCRTGTLYDGMWKDGQHNGRGFKLWANGMCHIVFLGLSAGHDSVTLP